MDTAPTASATVTEDKKEAPTTVEWVLWKHRCPNRVAQEEEWKGNIKEQAHFFARPTQEAFHMDLHTLPLPSKTFFLKTTLNPEGEHKTQDKHTEYSLFQKGIQPEWEDDSNAGELFARHFFPPELLDRYWLELAHGVMEGKIDDKYVCGIRVVDKSKGKHPMYKLELWLNTKEPHIWGLVRKQALACVEQDDHYRFNFHWREFTTSNSTSQAASESASEGAAAETAAS